MKKKIIICMLAGVLIFSISACGEAQNESEEKIEMSETVEQENITETTSTFEHSSSELAEILLDEKCDFYTNTVSGYTVDTFRKDYLYIYFVTASDEEYPGLIYIYDTKSPANTANAQALLNKLDTADINMDNIFSGDFELDNGYSLVAYLCKSNSDTINFPMQTLLPKNDFITTLGIETYNDLVANGQYETLYNSANEYIMNNTPPTYDNSYWIVNWLAPIMSDWNNITIDYDEFANTSYFYYSNITEISSTTHFVPYAKAGESGFNLLIGFYASDWLFFDAVEISCTPNNIKIGPVTSKSEEVIDGNTIYEYINTTSYILPSADDSIESLLSSDNHTIRFINDDSGEYYDFTMTKNELDALRVINEIGNVYSNLNYLSQLFE